MKRDEKNEGPLKGVPAVVRLAERERGGPMEGGGLGPAGLLAKKLGKVKRRITLGWLSRPGDSSGVLADGFKGPMREGGETGMLFVRRPG